MCNEEIDILEENKKLKEEVDTYKRLVEYLEGLELYEYSLDYDYDEEPIDNFYSFDMTYYIKNWLEADKIDKEEE